MARRNDGARGTDTADEFAVRNGGATTKGVTLAYVLAGALTATTVSLDVFLPQGFSVAYFYSVVVLLLGASRRKTVVVSGTAVAIALTVLAYFLKDPTSAAVPIPNRVFARVLACTVIAITAGLVLWALHEGKRVERLVGALISTQAARADARHMLAVASEIAPIGTWSASETGALEWSDAITRILGFPAGVQPTQTQIAEATIPEDRPRIVAAMTKALTEGEPFREEIRVLRADGEQRWCVIMGDKGELLDGVTTVHGTLQDITTWRRAEESAHTLSHRLAQFAAIMPIIIWTADPQGRIEYFNEALTRYAGEDQGDLLGDDWVEAVDPRDLDRVKKTWNHSIATGEPYDIEYRVRGANDQYEWHHLFAQAERAEDGTIIRWWGTSMNVHATRLLREEAASLAAERESILESMLDGVVAFDHAWTVTYINGAAERMFGRSREDTLGLALKDLADLPPGHNLRAAMGEAMYKRRPQSIAVHAEELGKWLDIAVTPSPMGVNVFIKDVTEVRHLSEQLAQAQRLESIGQLTGGIAHDFNNLLTVVLGGADALRDDPSVGPDATGTIELIEAAAERGAELTHRLLSFAKRQPLEPRSVDVARRIEGMIPLLRSTLGEAIDLHVITAPAPRAELDPSQFDNALLNLAINAKDAMPHGGSLTVEVMPLSIAIDDTLAIGEVTPGDYVLVTVTDTGVGISPDVLQHVFDPFYTTKEAGKGSGMGLAMVWGFVSQSGGHVTVYSEPGLGTSFKLYLPPSPSPRDDAPTGQVPAVAEHHTGTVLLVEDDDLVRAFALEQLRSHGFEVTAAATGPEALAALDGMPTIDLLFTDVIMPGGMTGKQLAEVVTAKRPGTPVLYASGYTENVVVHNGRLDAGVSLLAKPYSARQLVQRVGAMLAPHEEGSS